MKKFGRRRRNRSGEEVPLQGRDISSPISNIRDVKSPVELQQRMRDFEEDYGSKAADEAREELMRCAKE